MTFQKGYKPWNKKYDGPSGEHFCLCGCKELIPEFDDRGRPVRYKYKHGNRGRKFPGLKHDKQFSKGHTPHNKGIEGYSNSGTFKAGHEGLVGEQNPKWSGGYSLTKAGYLVNNRTKEYLHREIMEKELARELLQNEHVHHINHNRQDNRLENLVILTPEEHGKYHADTEWGKRKG